MKEIEVKREIEELDDIEECIPELTKLLEDVKREHVEENDHEPPSDVEDILKNLANDESSNSSDDADIQNLQELIKQKQNELAQVDATLKRKSETSGVQQSSAQKKRKKDELKRMPENDAKDNQCEKRRKENQVTPNDEGISNSSQVAREGEGESLTSVKQERLPTEEELENLLQSPNHSDEGPCSSSQLVHTHQGASFGNGQTEFPCNDGPSTEHLHFYNPDANFYDSPAEHFPAQVEEDELECLPVINSAGFTGMPTFRRIKLERPGPEQPGENVNSTDETPREKRQRIFSTCMSLLERMELRDQSGKFIFTPTIAKADSNEACNSVLRNISNVHYDFQSIGPKLNVSDWGLQAIGGGNGQIAKAIGISADVYFSKIKLKSDTVAGKLIKVETDHHEKESAVEVAVDEPNLSTFFKSTVTQTDPLVCQKCSARSRIVGHDVGVQARVYACSFGTQTYATGDDHSEMTAGLSGSQLNALYEFASLIRDVTENPSVEMFKSRAMEIYSVISPEHFVPNRRPPTEEWGTVKSNGSSYPAQSQQPPYGHEHSSHLPHIAPNHRPPHHLKSTHMPPSHLPPPHMPPTHMPPTHKPPTHMPPTHMPAHMPPTHMPPTHMPPAHMPPTHKPPPNAPPAHMPPMHMTPAQTYSPPNHTMSHRGPRQTGINPSPPRDPRQASINQSPPRGYWNPPPPADYKPHDGRFPGPLNHPPNSNPSKQGPPWQKVESRLGYGRGHRL